MRNIFKKTSSIILCLVIMFSAFSVSFVSNAAVIEDENEIMPLWTTIDIYGVDFDVSGFTATASVTLTSQVKTLLKIVIYLQKETSSGYETVESWNASKKSAYSLGLEESTTANIFYNYRIKVIMTAGSETITVYRYE